MKSNIFQAPRHIKINGYEYGYKDELANKHFYYLCKYRIKCKLTIKISINELKKY